MFGLNLKRAAWVFVSVVALLFIYTFMVGSGGFKRATTLTGWYAIPDVGGYDVVCFHLKNSDVGNCLPKSQVEKPL